MPTLPDLELNDFDLKPYMDPNILLDTFSAEDMDIWQSYNLFVDENINSPQLSKDQIKQEESQNSADLMDCCFSSICPNDLLNNSVQQVSSSSKTNTTQQNFNATATQNQYQIIQPVYTTNPQISYEQQSSNEYYSTNSSSCSSSPSLESNQYFEQAKQQPNTIQLGLDSISSYNTQPQQRQQQNCIAINSLDNGTFQTIYGTNVNFSTVGDNSNKIGYFRINSDEPSLSPSSSTSSSSLSTSSASSTNGDFNQFQGSKKIQKLCDIQPLQQQSIIILEPQQLKNKIPPTTETSSHKISRKSANILPPSPPSSFGSDSESNQSSSSSTNQTTQHHQKTGTTKSTGLKANKLLKSNKLNSLRANGGSLAKQMRQSAYSFKQAQIKSAKAKVTIKTECLDTSNSLLNLSTNSDDDCWPFLCSLSKLPSSGPIMLTEEEKRTLVQEGHQVPSQLPLTKSEEKILKKIRRKIKNKISAQESRRKKKEYVDSLEKRMENYINENVELKKRLESLEINNKSLLQQLQKMKSSIQCTTGDEALDFNEDAATAVAPQNKDVLNIQSANQFGTLLMVLVLFFTVLLGVWSPMITKDHMSQASATAAAAASISVRSATRSPSGSFSYSAASATTTAAVAAASLALVSSVAAVKSESLSPQAVDQASSCFNNRPVIMNDDEDDFLADDLILTGQINNNVLTTRSKAGNTIELTKVRPFVRRLPIAQSQQQDYVVVNNQEKQQQPEAQEAQQIIVLNVAPSANQITKISEVQQQQQPTGGVESSVKQYTTSTTQQTDNIPVNSNGQQQLVSKPLNPSLISLGTASVNSGSGYRVINTQAQNTNNNSNTAVNAQKLNAVSGPKLPTRFRLINNGLNTFNNHHMAPSVIKLNTLA